MAHSVGDSVWSVTTFVEFDGRVRCHVHPAEVVGVIHDIVMLRSALGSIRPVEAGSETICDNEADAWAEAARELAEARDRVQIAIEEAIAKAASCRVGEAIAT